MVDIVVGLDESGALRRLELKGHAGDSPRGENLACAAVTLLARSVARVAAARTGWTVDGTAPGPGNLSLVIKGRPEDTDEWLLGVTDTLLQALADIAEDYPGTISVNREELRNGS